MQVSGYMYPCALEPAAGSGFLPSISCWGWATWDRAWRLYDGTLAAWDAILRDPPARRSFDMEGAYDYSGMIERVRAGKLESWGVIWYLSVFSCGGLVLYPRKSLVSNTGFDGSGTHADHRTRNMIGAVSLWDAQGQFQFPERVETDRQYYSESRRLILGSQMGWRSWLRRFIRR